MQCSHINDDQMGICRQRSSDRILCYRNVPDHSGMIVHQRNSQHPCYSNRASCTHTSGSRDSGGTSSFGGELYSSAPTGSLSSGCRCRRTAVSLSCRLLCLVAVVFVSHAISGRYGIGLAAAAGQTILSAQFNFTEEQPVGSRVGRIPTPQGTSLTYRLSQNSSFFSIDPLTGVLTSTAVIDLEALPGPFISLLVQSFPSPPAVIVQVTIQIIGINDSPPRFPSPRVGVSFEENSPPGTTVYLDPATDPDNDPIVDYKIISGNPYGVFQLTLAPTGTVLYLQNTVKLDRENQSSYTLNISCHDVGIVLLYGYLTVDVSVVDVNDHAPVFDAQTYHVTINELAPLGTQVVEVQASDADAGQNAVIVYSIQDGNSDGQFSIDPNSGILTTAVSPPLRCSTSCDQVTDPSCQPSSCLLTIQAQDSGQPPYSSYAQVYIALADVNDQAPVIVFRNRVSPSIPLVVDIAWTEGTIVEAVSVTDSDEGSNGHVTARVVSGNSAGDFVFSPAPISGLFFLTVGPNHLVINSRYNLTIEAKDSGTPPQVTTATLLLAVDGSPPSFLSAVYTAEIVKTAPAGSYVTAVSATMAVTGKVTYSIASGNDANWFRIDQNTGLITTASSQLSRVQLNTINLSVQAAANYGGMSSTASSASSVPVIITVLPGNRSAPSFTNRLYSFSVSASQAMTNSFQIGSVLASVESVSATVIYELAFNVPYNYPGTFRISRLSGQLSTLQPLVPGTLYMISVVATNSLSLASSQCTVAVNVSLPPVQSPVIYPSMYFARTQVGSAIGTQLVQIRLATDISSSSSPTFSVSSTSAGSRLAVDARTGYVTIAQSLTSRTVYSMTISASNALGQTSQLPANVQIFVVAAGYVSPIYFVQSAYAFSVVEDDARLPPVLGRTVGQVTTSVLGSSNPGSVLYYVVDGNSLGIFAINNATGVLTTAKAVDAEQQAAYNLSIVATSASDFTVVYVSITIIDVNDNPPRFISGTTAETEVPADAAVNLDVYAATARDSDVGLLNGAVRYSLLSANSSSLFSIDPTSGLIRIAADLNPRTSDVMSVTVIASDLGLQPLSAVQTVTIYVIQPTDDVDPPMFNASTLMIRISESTPVNTRFFNVASALVTGSGFPPPPTTFIITRFHGVNDGKMAIFPDGWLYVTASLNAETKYEYVLTVMAMRYGFALNRSSSADVVIVVGDENDNKPTFANSTFEFSIVENAPATDFAELVQATDADRGRNADIVYSIQGASNFGFSIDPLSGLLTTSMVFDREELIRQYGTDVVTVVVAATDNGVTPLQGMTTVYVSIADVNDEPPVFSRPVYVATIADNATVNSVIVQVAAVDPDLGRSVLYYLTDDGDGISGTFQIDQLSGMVFLAARLDYLVQSMYTLVVMAIDDSMVTALNSTAVVVINVVEGYQRPPVWKATNFTVSVGRRSPIGSLVAEVSAVDPDRQRQSAVTYRAVSQSGADVPFSVDQQTGRIYLNRSLAVDSVGRQYKLLVTSTYVTATALFAPGMSSSTVITFVVVDFNTVDTPVFSTGQSAYHVTSGATVNSVVFSVGAFVPRLGINADMTYAISRLYPVGQPMVFEVNPTNGIVTVSGTIDRNRTASYSVILSARDRRSTGTNALTAEQAFSVIVYDSNTVVQSLEFLSPSAILMLSNTTQGSRIAVIRAIVPDAGTKYLVRYSISGGADSSMFNVDSISGSLYVGVGLSSSVFRPTFSLTVTAADSLSPARNSSLQLTVIVVKSSPAAADPSFSRSSYSGQVVENSPAFTVVATVAATSTAAQSQINYYITDIRSVDGQPQPNYFNIDPLSGALLATRPIDVESSPAGGVFIVQVCAVDVSSTSFPRTANTTVRVTVLDVNDNPPVFASYPSNVLVSETAPVGTSIATFVATDRDVAATVRLTISCGMNDHSMTINSSTGLLQVSGTFDRTRTALYQLCITASDGVNTATVNVNVTVSAPTNNLSLQFLRSIYVFDVDERLMTASGGSTVLGLVTAKLVPDLADLDPGLYSPTYRIVSNWTRSSFNYDPTYGVLSLVGSVDYDKLSLYSLAVECLITVNTSLSLRAAATVYVNVIYNNDAPVFNMATSSSVVFVTSDVPIGHSVATVTATISGRAGLNGGVSYKIIGGDPYAIFVINPTSGQIQTAKALYQGLNRYYSLIVEATNQATDPRNQKSSETVLTVVIVDPDKFIPVFNIPSTISVSENAPVSSSVFTVVAGNAAGSYITYRLLPTGLNSATTFSVGQRDGLLQLQQPLNYNTQSQYNLTIVATDSINNRSASFQLTVNVIAGNYRTPRFSSSSYSVVVREDTPVGTTLLSVGAVDADVGLAGTIRYDIVSGNDGMRFDLDGYSGDLTIWRTLNYDLQSSYQLTVVARDLATSPRSSSANVTVSITRSFGRTPQFIESPFIGHVYENLAPIYVGRVVARTDGGSRSTAALVYSLVDNEVASRFSVNSSSGVITAVSAFDRETTPSYSFEVVVMSPSYPSLSSTSTMSVVVADANDNAPVFNHASYEARIVERQPAGTAVLQPWATDADVDRNALIRYTLDAASASGSFAIDLWSGQITTTRSLDRQRQSSYNLVVIATDCGLVPLSASAVVTVNVLGANNQTPMYLQPSYAVQLYGSVSAGGFVAGVTAIDPDLLSSSIAYSLSSPSIYFAIGSTTGIITTLQNISSSTVPTSSLTVVATKVTNPSLTNSTAVSITLSPSSPSYIYPQFTSTTRQFTTAGSAAVNSVIGTVSATTLRQGVTALSYFIAGGNVDDTLALDSSSGQLSVKRQLQYWRVPLYSLWIEARDNGVPPLSTFQNFSVSVSAFNQFYPVFVNVWYNATVFEQQIPPVSVVQIAATDQDVGQAGVVNYALANTGNVGGTVFSIGTSTGLISTTQKLNYETASVYHLVVLAYDRGTPSLTSTATVDVVVKGINKYPPVFTQLFQATVYENAPVGTFVLQVTSTDADANSVTMYSLTSSAGGLFAIDSVTGTITVAGQIDYEQSSEFILRVSANDGAFNTETAVTVDVAQENDQAPVCASPRYDFDVLENQPIGTALGNFSAVTYETTAPSSQNFFRLRWWSRDFVIYAGQQSLSERVSLRFQTFGSSTQQPSPLNVRRMEISVVNRGEPPLESSCPVTVTVFARNVFGPVFSQSSYQVVVPAGAGAGFSVMSIAASDGDINPVSSLITYSLQSAVDSFYIDPQTGLVTLTKLLSSNSSLLVTAMDHGIPPKSATVPVYVYVIPVNSFAIQFVGSQQAFIAPVPEDRPIGYVVGTVQATYAGGRGLKGVIQYSITGGNVGQTFHIDATSGVILIASKLDYEVYRRYDLVIRASDSTALTLFSTKNFTVLVTDVNDNAPRFDRDYYDVQIVEDAPVGATLIQLNAIDADRVAIAVVQYRVTGGNSSGQFEIDQFTGVIRLVAQLNYSAARSYVMTVQAFNPGTQLNSSATVSVTVAGVNRNVPIFQATKYTFALPNVSTVASGFVVGRVSAFDADAGLFGQIEYYFVGDANIGRFTIDRTTGSISTSGSIATPFANVTQLVVVAKNPEPLRPDNFASCQVYILSPLAAQFSLLFSRSLYSVSISENTPIGSTALQVAVDVFDVTATSVTYAIAAGNVDGSFVIDSQTGLLLVARQLKSASVSQYNLTVSATINAVPVKSATTQVEITVVPVVIITRPFFNPSIPVITVTDGQSPGIISNLTQFTQCTCSQYSSGPFRYQLVNFLNTFSINPTSGVVSTVVTMDRTVAQSYNVTVVVTVASLTESATSLQFQVLVLRSNDLCTTTAPSGSGSTCMNGGTCVLGTNGGNVCRCPAAYRGSLCEVAPVTFPTLSYIEHVAVTSSSRSVNVTLDVVTTKLNALVLYATTSSAAFLSVELVEGIVLVSYRQTDGSIARIYINQFVSDGLWHHILVQLTTSEGVSVMVSNCTAGLPNCNECYSNSCFTYVENGAVHPSLMPTWSFVAVAGVSNMSTILNRIGEVSEFDFAGCLRAVYLDGYDLLIGGNRAAPLKSTADNSAASCSRSKANQSLCLPNPCLNGGTCVDDWTGYRCMCPINFMGSNCATASAAVSFGGASDVLVYQQKETYVRQQQLETALLSSTYGRRKRQTSGQNLELASVLSLSFASVSNQGLLASSVGQNGATYLYVNNGRVWYSSLLTNAVWRHLPLENDTTVGSWHNVTLVVNGRYVLLAVDNSSVSATYDTSVHDPLGLDVQTISVGGSLSPVQINANPVPGLMGCIGSFLVNGVQQPMDGSNNRFTVERYGGVKSDCRAIIVTSPVVPISSLSPAPTTGAVTSPAWQIPVIVVCAIVGFLLLVVTPVVVAIVCCRRRRASNKEVPTGIDDRKARNGSVPGIIAANGHKDQDWRSQHSFGSNGNGGCTSLGDIRLTSLPLQQQPDVIVPAELHTSSPDSESLKRRTMMTEFGYGHAPMENGRGFDNHGYSEPERLDAGSQLYPIYPYDGSSPVPNGGKVSLVQSLANGDLLRSPTRLQYIRPKSISPHDRASFGRAANTSGPSSVSAPSPADGKLAGQHFGGQSLRSTPLNTVEVAAPDGGRLPGSETAARGRVVSPAVGLTVDDVNRITENRRGTPAAQSTMTTSSSDDNDDDGRISPDVINRTEFTREDLNLLRRTPNHQSSVISQLDGSSSDDDDTNYDTFTNSEYDGNRTAPTASRPLDFGDPYRLRLRPAQTSASHGPNRPGSGGGGGRASADQLVDSGFAAGYSSAESTMDETFSVDDRQRPVSALAAGSRPSSTGRSSVDILRAAEQLNWGLRIDLLVGVFNDIAAFPDDGSRIGRSLAISPNGRRSEDLPPSRPLSGSGSSSSRTRPSSNHGQGQGRTFSPNAANYNDSASVTQRPPPSQHLGRSSVNTTPLSHRSLSPAENMVAADEDIYSGARQSMETDLSQHGYLSPASMLQQQQGNWRQSPSEHSSDGGLSNVIATRTAKNSTPIARTISPLGMIRESDEALSTGPIQHQQQPNSAYGSVRTGGRGPYEEYV